MSQPAPAPLRLAPDAQELFEREVDDFEAHAHRFLAMVRQELPDVLGDVVIIQGGAILGAIERLTRARALASGAS